MNILEFLLLVVYLSEGTLFLVKMKQKYGLDMNHTKKVSKIEKNCREPAKNDTDKMM